MIIVNSQLRVEMSTENFFSVVLHVAVHADRHTVGNIGVYCSHLFTRRKSRCDLQDAISCIILGFDDSFLHVVLRLTQ